MTEGMKEGLYVCFGEWVFEVGTRRQMKQMKEKVKIDSIEDL